MSASGLIPFLGALALAAALVALALARAQLRYRRERFIRTSVLPRAVLDELAKAYPHLEEKDLFLVARALRMFFLLQLRAGGRMLFMPSKAVDALWHAFILDTRAYHAFCRHAFGRYFHHVPSGRMAADIQREPAVWRTWALACREENIPPAPPTRLPLLFAIDEKLRIPDGSHYSLAQFAMRRSTGGGGCGGSGCGGSGDGGGGGCGGD